MKGTNEYRRCTERTKLSLYAIEAFVECIQRFRPLALGFRKRGTHHGALAHFLRPDALRLHHQHYV